MKKRAIIIILLIIAVVGIVHPAMGQQSQGTWGTLLLTLRDGFTLQDEYPV